MHLEWAGIAVTPGLGEKWTADQDSRSSDQAEADRLPKSGIEPARIPDRCEAGLEGGLDLVGNPQGQHCRRKGDLAQGIEFDHGEVDMGVEQAGHERPALAVDQAAAARTGGAGGRSNPTDATLLDHDVHAGLRIAPGAVEDGGVLED